MGGTGHADGFATKPDRSLFVGIDLGTGLHPGKEVRSPDDLYNPPGAGPEAYSAAGFLLGISAGFRFNEQLAIELGWHEQQHDAHDAWGGVASFNLSHLALRFAIPFYTRQTLVFDVGPAIGGFRYGDVAGTSFDDNGLIATGGVLGITLEHELMLGVVATLNLTYLPLARIGKDEVLILCGYVYEAFASDYDQECPEGAPHDTPYQPLDSVWVKLDEKDFSKTEFIQLFWLSVGIQFEWTFR